MKASKAKTPYKINTVQCDFLPLVNLGLQVSSLKVQGWDLGQWKPRGGSVAHLRAEFGPELLLLHGECQQKGTQHSLHGTTADFKTFPASGAMTEYFLLPLISRVGAQIPTAIFLQLMIVPQYQNCSRLNDSFQQRVMSVTL